MLPKRGEGSEGTGVVFHLITIPKKDQKMAYPHPPTKFPEYPKIDSTKGREMYSHRMGIVEPVFGNIRSAKRLSRFSLRGRKKVNTQWLLFCMMHNIGKIQRYGMQAGEESGRRDKKRK